MPPYSAAPLPTFERQACSRETGRPVPNRTTDSRGMAESRFRLGRRVDAGIPPSQSRGLLSDYTDVHALVREAIDDLGRSDRLGSVLEKAIRIAELRRDVYNLWWLRLEAIGYRNERARAQWNLEIADQIPAQMRDSLLMGIVRDSQERREYIAFDETTGERKNAVSTWSVAETDALIDEREAHVATPPPPADSPEAYAFWMATRLEATLALTQWKRVRAR